MHDGRRPHKRIFYDSHKREHVTLQAVRIPNLDINLRTILSSLTIDNVIKYFCFPQVNATCQGHIL